MAIRTIIFRGKRINSMKAGEWAEGFFMEWLNPRKNRKEARIQTISEGGCIDLIHEVDPDTVGQYTGLKDKNGKRIFEGDIVTTDIKRPYLVVEYRDGCFMFNCNDGGKDYYDIMLPILNEPQTQYEYGEVIGNIHDNPEWLEVR